MTEVTGMRALERGLAVIRFFTDLEEPATISDISRGTGFDRAVVRRVLGTLEGLGYVTKADNRFRLLPSVLELGYAYLSSDPLPRIAQDRLRPFAERVQESCSLGIMENNHVRYLARVHIKRVAGTTLAIGSMADPHTTSIGRVLLSGLNAADLETAIAAMRFERLTDRTIVDPERFREELSLVRDQGWCLIDQEVEIGLLALAVPVRGRDQQIVAAINVITQTFRYSPEGFVQEMLPGLLETAGKIEADIRHLAL
jgi:IclR family pca regulon transcriptional regulator